MTLNKVTLALATLAVGIAGAASSYSVRLNADFMAGDTPLKAGTYTVKLNGDQAIFSQGKTSASFSVTVEKRATPYRDTALEANGSALQAIDLGGTNTKIVFTPKPGVTTSAATK